MKKEIVYYEKLFGIRFNPSYKKEVFSRDLFETPLLHKEIHGDKVFVPLDLDRLWGMKPHRLG